MLLVRKNFQIIRVYFSMRTILYKNFGRKLGGYFRVTFEGKPRGRFSHVGAQNNKKFNIWLWSNENSIITHYIT